MAPKYTNVEIFDAVLANIALFPALLAIPFVLYFKITFLIAVDPKIFNLVQLGVKICFRELRGAGKKETVNDTDVELGSIHGHAWEHHARE